MFTNLQLETLRNYTIHHLIGQGTFSKVYEAEKIKSATLYAIKVIPKCFSEQAETEINLFSNITHPTFVKLHEVLSDDESFYVVMELITKGTLLQHLNHLSNFSEHDACILFSHIFEGLCHLHNELKVAHLDLKLENIMIDSTSHARIIDMGLSRSFSALNNLTTKRGSHPYCSPEMLTGKMITAKTDIWSLGVLLYALVAGEFPFSASDSALLTSKILFDQLNFPMNVSSDFKDLVTKMLDKESVTRITLAEIANHPWMANDCSSRSHICETFSMSQLHFRLRPSLPSMMISFTCTKTNGSNQSTEMIHQKSKPGIHQGIFQRQLRSRVRICQPCRR
jgi:serine/threonine protein kinase